MSMICDHFHSIDSQVKSIAYSCTRSLREQDGNIPPIKSTAVPNTLTQQRRCYHATRHLHQMNNRPIWRHRHMWTSPQNMQTPLLCNTQHHGNTAVIPRSFKMNNVEYICTQSVSKTSQQRTNIVTTGRTITLYTARWKRYLCGMDFVKRFERPALSITLLSTLTLQYSHRTTH